MHLCIDDYNFKFADYHTKLDHLLHECPLVIEFQR